MRTSTIVVAAAARFWTAVERLTFAIDAVPSAGGVVAIRRETTRVWVPLTVVR